VGRTVLGDGPAGGDQRLGRDLPAEDARDDRGPGPAAEDVLLEPLEIEQLEEDLECLAHGDSVVPAGVGAAYRPMSFAMIVFMISLVPP
jgi:hypothetical protein